MSGMDALLKIGFQTDVFDDVAADVRLRVEVLGRDHELYLYRVHVQFDGFEMEVFRSLDGGDLGPLHFRFTEEEVDLDAIVPHSGLCLRDHAASSLAAVRSALSGGLGSDVHQGVRERLLSFEAEDFTINHRLVAFDRADKERREELVQTARSLTSSLDAQNRTTRRKYEDLLHLLEQIWTTFSKFEDEGDWLGRDAVDSLAGRLQEVRAELHTAPVTSEEPRTILELAHFDEQVGVDSSVDLDFARSLAAAHANAVGVQQRVDEACLKIADASVGEFERALKAKVSRLVARAFNPLQR